MILAMTDINDIKELYFKKGLNVAEMWLEAEYGKIKKEEIFSDEPKFFLPLKHLPGEAQVDFGRTDFRENGTFYEGRHLNLSFPQSNTGYAQLFKGENLQCLEQGMINIFNYLGGVPARIVFDNASSMVSDIGKNKY